ncbi:MAG: DUF4350 domain-containing protein [Bacteroidota bacterium]
MKKLIVYIKATWLLAVLLACAACNTNNGKRKMPKMNPPYRYRDKEPMGTNIAYRLLPYQFNADILLASKKTEKNVNWFSYVKGTAYIVIGKNIVLDNDEVAQLLNYVELGNEFFISASNIDYRLLDTLGVRHSSESYLTEDDTDRKINTSLQVADTVTYGNKRYGFFYYPFRDIFTGYDSSTTTVLGINQSKHANYIVVRHGKGKFYFHTEPAAFSNYFLLTADNTEYYKQVFSYLNKNANTVLWGDLYKFGKPADDFSALSIFWKNPPLKYAMLAACALMLLYIAFGSKRKRRLVPAMPANNNASLSFVHTIGNLYLQKKDNRNIAIKMMTYFFEHVRNSYHLNTNNINTEFVQALSRKSGIDEKKVQSLMEKADDINMAETVSDQELFDINNLVYEFYKK